jgi:hypothetical protein
MARFLNVLAASIGGGLLLGAGLRALEHSSAEATHGANGNGAAGQKDLLDRLNAVERRIRDLGSQNSAGSERDVRQWTSTEISRQVADAAARLELSAEAARKEAFDHLTQRVEERLAGRITLLEQEVQQQSLSLGELRECSLRTEKSMQRLLEGIERLVSSQPGHSPAH